MHDLIDDRRTRFLQLNKMWFMCRQIAVVHTLVFWHISILIYSTAEKQEKHFSGWMHEDDGFALGSFNTG